MWQLGTAGPQRVDRIFSYGAADIWGQRVRSELRCLCAKHLRGRVGVAHTCYWLHQEASGLLLHLRDLPSLGLGHNPSHKDHPKDHLWLFKRDQQPASMVLKTLVAMFPHVPSLGMWQMQLRGPRAPKVLGANLLGPAPGVWIGWFWGRTLESVFISHSPMRPIRLLRTTVLGPSMAIWVGNSLGVFPFSFERSLTSER